MSFAKVIIVGRLGSDPETKYTQNGTLIISFSMAADGRRRGGDNSQPNTTWFRVSAFAQQAERLANMVERGYIAKGRMLYVEGQFEARPYTGTDGKERVSNDVTMTDWQFIGSGQQQDQQRGPGGQSGGFSGNQGGNQTNYGGGRNDSVQESESSYGGSKYGNEFPSGDEPSDMNDVPF